VLSLGSDLPAVDIAHAAHRGQARVVALSVVYANGLAHVAAELDALGRDLDPSVGLVVGGRAAGEIQSAIRGSRAHVLSSLADLRVFLAARPEAPRLEPPRG
jgi:hypothetical protein